MKSLALKSSALPASRGIPSMFDADAIDVEAAPFCDGFH